MNKLLIIFLLLASCSENETARTQGEVSPDRSTPSIVGTWVLAEQKVSIGGPATWQAAAERDTIQLNADGSFSWENPDCDPKSYQQEGTLIKLTYDCPEDSEYADRPGRSDRIDYQIVELTSSYLTITPATFRCIEACLYKYARQENPKR